MRTLVAACCVVATAALAPATRLAAQSAAPRAVEADSATRAFVARVIAGTAAWQDRSAAIAAGFKLLGTDFPSMGEHWVSTRLVLAGGFDIERPSMLSYAQVDGRPRLIGVIYAVPLTRGESPPALPDGLKASWHEHNGTVEEESLTSEHSAEQMMDHAAGHAAASGAAGRSPSLRIALLHAWVLLPNPDGLFAADNWALPFIRLGLAVPRRFSGGAARALSLVSGSDRFYLDAVRTASHPDREGETAARAALAECRAAAVAVLARPRAAAALSIADLEELGANWDRLLALLDASVGAKATDPLRPGRLR